MNRFTLGLLTTTLGIGLVSGLSWHNLLQARDRAEQEQSQLEQERTKLIEEKTAFDLERAQHRQAVLSKYFESMQSLFNQGLKSPSASLTVKAEAEAVTLETLQQLDGEGKGELLKFLYQERLIGHCPLHMGRQYCTIPGRIPVLSLVGADFRKAKLSEISLNGADLRGVDLRGADLRNTDLTRVRFNKANLSGANLSGAKLLGVDLSDAYLRVAILQKTVFGCENWHFCRGVAILRRTDLQGTDLTDANLGRTILVEANLREAVLINVKLAGADLTQTSFVGANLSGASFSHYWKGSCSDMNWERDIAIIEQTDFTNANLSQANLRGLMTNGAEISGAEMSGAILDSAIVGHDPSADEC